MTSAERIKNDASCAADSRASQGSRRRRQKAILIFYQAMADGLLSRLGFLEEVPEPRRDGKTWDETVPIDKST